MKSPFSYTFVTAVIAAMFLTSCADGLMLKPVYTADPYADTQVDVYSALESRVDETGLPEVMTDLEMDAYSMGRFKIVEMFIFADRYEMGREVVVEGARDLFYQTEERNWEVNYEFAQGKLAELTPTGHEGFEEVMIRVFEMPDPQDEGEILYSSPNQTCAVSNSQRPSTAKTHR